MMEAWIYQADLYCDDCARAIRARLDAAADAEEAGSPDDGDSGSYPQGPYADGGGEADCPQHCGGCGVFLENPLTSEGHEYVCEAVAEAVAAVLQGRREPITPDSALGQWIAYYDVGAHVGGRDDEPVRLAPSELLAAPRVRPDAADLAAGRRDE